MEIGMPWYIAGPVIGLIYTFVLLLGKSFGVSSNFRTLCSMLGAGKKVPFFDWDYKSKLWNLAFLMGVFLAGVLLPLFAETIVPQISEDTLFFLSQVGMEQPEGLVPQEVFQWSWKSVAVLAVGGLLIGFGTRYAGGCTSGHAISGLSQLQLPSLIAVIGFFAGGLFVTHLVLPYLLPILAGV
jgi:uncharacterized membrane protein YedE/YeeE